MRGLTALERAYSSLSHGSRLIAVASEGAELVRRDGVLAVVVPAARERSVLNCVTYEKPPALIAAYGELAAAYDEIGAAWTVWVPPGDDEVTTHLAERGHVLDAEPEAMARTLEQPPARPPLEDWTADGSMSDVGAINDLAYGYDGSFARALPGLSGEGLFVYVARVEGRPAGCLVAVDLGANTDIEWVAVLAEARGRGLSAKLLAHALADAAERGQESSTLVATKLGRPVYERLGYRGVGALQMWERRDGLAAT
jgi:GNAT superfamily N-acetyltransferase